MAKFTHYVHAAEYLNQYPSKRYKVIQKELKRYLVECDDKGVDKVLGWKMFNLNKFHGINEFLIDKGELVLNSAQQEILVKNIHKFVNP